MDEKVTIRVPKELLDGIDTLVSLGEFTSRSDAVRASLKETLSKKIHTSITESEQISLDLPKRFISDLDFLVKVDYFPSRELAIQEAVKIQLYETLDLYKIKTRSEAMQEIGFDLASAEIEKGGLDKLLKTP